MKLRRVLALLIPLALVAAACGSDDDDSGSAETEASEGDEMAVPEDWPESVIFGFVPSQEQEELIGDIEPSESKRALASSPESAEDIALGTRPGKPRKKKRGSVSVRRWSVQSRQSKGLRRMSSALRGDTGDAEAAPARAAPTVAKLRLVLEPPPTMRRCGCCGRVPRVAVVRSAACVR